jgi:hypothetical protein
MIRLSIFCTSLLLWGCSGQQLDTHEFAAFYAEELKMPALHTAIDGIQYSVSYLPVEYLILQDNPGLTTAQVRKEALQYAAEGLVFRFSCETPEGTSAMGYEADGHDGELERLQQLSRELEPLFYIKGATKEYPCKLAVFERKYGVSRNLSFRVFFDATPEELKGGRFVFDDYIFRNGRIQFELDEVFDNQPELK